MNLFDLIDVDHVNLKQMMAQLLATAAGDVDERAELRRIFGRDLTIHMEAEEETLYLDLIDVDEFDLAFEALEEHMAMRFMLERVEQTRPADTRWIATFRVFSDIMNRHLQSEEDVIFPLARSTFTDEKTQQQGQRYIEAKRIATAKLAGEGG